MAVIIDGKQYYFPPGAQNPGKYPFVGTNYGIYGEQPGWVYDPWKDKYIPDPNAQQQLAEQQGLVEPEQAPPGLAETLLPIAGVGLALTGGQALGGEIPDLIKGVPGLLGFGDEAANTGAALNNIVTPTATVTTQATSAAVPVGSALNGGTLMSDGTIAGSPFFSLDSAGLLGPGPMPVGNYLPGIAGAYGMYDLLSNKKHGTSGALQGAASGAGIGFTVGGPVGAGIGAAIGGITGYFGNFGDVDAYKTEWKRKKKLYDQGLITEAQLGPEPTSGKSKEQLIAEAKATGGNVTFAGSRNESDLMPVDIQGYATILEKAAQTGISAQDLASRALQAGAVREHHGTIDVDWTKVNLGQTAPSPTPTQSAPPLQNAGAPLPERPQDMTQIPRVMPLQRAAMQTEPMGPGLLSNRAPMPTIPAPQPVGMRPTPLPQNQPVQTLPYYPQPGTPQYNQIQGMMQGQDMPQGLTNVPFNPPQNMPGPQPMPQNTQMNPALSAPAPLPPGQPPPTQQPAQQMPRGDAPFGRTPSGMPVLNPSGWDIDKRGYSPSIMPIGLLSMRG